MCVPPAWGEKIPGIPLRCRCVLCLEEDRHHAVRCIECRNAPGCCACILGYMHSHYNSGCPLCRHGDPGDENPLGIQQTRQIPQRSGELVRLSRRARNVARRERGSGGVLVFGRRGRGRGRRRAVAFGLEPARPSRGGRCRGRRGFRGGGKRRGMKGRGTTVEGQEEDQPEK